MKTRLFSMVGMLCLVTVGSGVLANMAVAQPETEEITLGVLVNYTGTEFTSLSEVIGDDTNGIFLDKYFPDSVAIDLIFGSGQFCEDIDVSNTSWSGVGDAKIINKGGPLDAIIFSDGLFPPDRYMLLARDITDVRACWVKTVAGNYFVQAAPDASTSGAFFIITGEFRVDD